MVSEVLLAEFRKLGVTVIAAMMARSFGKAGPREV
jgi:hypothetical protein